MSTPEDPNSAAIEASAHALAIVYEQFFKQAGDDQELLNQLFDPTLTAEAKRLGIDPAELLVQVTRVFFGPDNVFEQSDENDIEDEGLSPNPTSD